MTFDEFKEKWIGKSYQENVTLGKQCVAMVKLFAQEVQGIKLWSFWWSAINWRNTGSPFKWLPFSRTVYSWSWSPKRGDVVFFAPTKKNKFWHVAIAWLSTNKELRVIEQNAAKWSGTWENGDEISIRSYPYKGGRTGDVLGWFTLKETTSKDLYWK